MIDSIINFNIYKNFIYLLIAFFAFLFLLDDKNKNKQYFNIVLISFFSILFIILFGTRESNIGTDTLSYLKNYKKIVENSLDLESSSDTVFYLLSKFNHFFLYEQETILLLMSFVYVTYISLFCIHYSKKDSYFLFFIFSSLFFFYNLGINILRQGLAVSFFLFSLTYLKKRSLRNLYFVLAILSHVSSITLILIFSISNYLKLKLALIILAISIVLSYLKFDFNFILNYIPIFKRFMKYTNEDGYLASMYDVGFKPKFVLFNLFFLIVGLLIDKYIIKNEDKFYNKILITFCLISSVFFLCFNIPFSDRIGIYSWCLIPLIIIPVFSYKYKNMLFYRFSMFFILIICNFLIN